MREGPLTQATEPDAAAPAASALRERAAATRSLAFALAGTFVLRCASYSAGTIIPVFLGLKSRSDSDVTANLAALVAVTFYASELLGAPVFGALSDRRGRKLFMLLGPIFGGIAIQLLGFSSIIPVLVLVRVLEGLSTASSTPATLGYLSAQTAGSLRLRARAMGFYEAATVVGLASGAFVGGQLYERFSTLAFTFVALIYVLALLLFAFVRDRRDETPVEPAHGGLIGRMFSARILRFAPAWLAANAVLGIWLNVGSFVAAGRSNPRQLLMGSFGAGDIGFAFMAFGVLFTGGAIVWSFVMPRIGRQATLRWGVGGLALMTGALWLLNQSPREATPLIVGLGLLLMVGVFVESGFTPAALAYLAEIAEEQKQDRGSVMGIYSVLLGVGQLSGAALAGPFAERWGMNGLIALTGLLCLVAGATVMLLGVAERRAAAPRVQPEAV